jgi:hypothetical protein
MSYTNGISNNTKSYMDVARKYIIAANLQWLVAIDPVIADSEKAVSWYNCQISSV